ncbi:MAG TPA: F0F1 ATP synthase subunit epsilon [Candidatus Magasanikbacteria bacterium]|nr:F0F1 ATP synthase subunit epsilon [Candidatus Magasanikbacteria bacterium]HBX15852.1 F0F1 ATP synthase subunit epsilon [Candidatus Magasanikbacteria bacterium]
MVMPAKISFEITTPERTIFKDEIDQITLPTEMGEITILPNHIPLVSMLRPGEMRLIKNGAESLFAVAGGFIEIQPNNRVIVLADNAERAEEISIERAEAARQRAEELMKQKSVQDVEYTGLAVKIERELARLRVARKHRGKHSGRVRLDE